MTIVQLSVRVRQSSIPGITDRLRNDDYVIQAYQSSIPSVAPSALNFVAHSLIPASRPGLFTNGLSGLKKPVVTTLLLP